ncbi:MAG: HD domain-containing phosphohydrolase, partial [Pseudohongiellaceae bacterium]
LASGKHVVSNDFLKDPRTEPWREAARTAGIGASAAFPFRAGGEFVGTLNLYASEPEYFSAKELDTLDTLAKDISYGLDNLDRIQQLSTESKVIESSPVVLFRWRASEGWPVEFVSQNVRQWGYSAAGLMSGRIKFEQMVHPDDLLRIQQEMENYTRDRASEFTQIYRIVTNSGATRWVQDNTLIERNVDGVINFYQGTLTDITESKIADETIQSYVKKLESAVLGTAAAVSQMVELRDPYTAGHERRVGMLAAAIAAEMGLDENVQKGLQIAGAVHDVGKIVVPAEILTKPGRLSAAELALIQEHAEQGYSVLKDVEFPWPVAEVARQHHERLDGSGYPRGLKGDDILLEARIIAVADVVEAMSSNRPYRPTKGITLALEEIEKGAGRLFDTMAVAACLKLFREKGYTLPE